jgi:hypothetical protein
VTHTRQKLLGVTLATTTLVMIGAESARAAMGSKTPASAARPAACHRRAPNLCIEVAAFIYLLAGVGGGVRL